MVGSWHDTGDRCNKLDGWFVALISCRCLQLAGVCSILLGCSSEFCFWWILRVFNSEVHRYYVSSGLCWLSYAKRNLSWQHGCQCSQTKTGLCRGVWNVCPNFLGFPKACCIKGPLWVCLFILFKSLLRRMGNLFTCHLIQSWLF